MNPQELMYSKTHEWVHLSSEDGNKVATVGISAFAVEQLTDLVYIELPDVGRQVQAGEPFGAGRIAIHQPGGQNEGLV